VDLDYLAQRLVTGLVRVAVAAGDCPDPLERTLAQQQALVLLARRDRCYPLTELAADLGMPLATVQTAVATLAREGLVDVGPAPSYAPQEVRVALTERGRAQAPNGTTWADSLLAQLDALDEPDQRQLLALVVEQIASMQRHGRIPVTRMCVNCRYFDAYAHPGRAEPHHCWYVDAPFGNRDLRLRCPEQVPAD
jgi:DNA-binding MarR family transcriptional regulator